MYLYGNRHTILNTFHSARSYLPVIPLRSQGRVDQYGHKTGLFYETVLSK